MAFNRGLSNNFIELLDAEAKNPGWWRDVLHDPRLLIGVREEYLNVYWQGQSLFLVKPIAGKLRVTTHEKFLLDPDLQGQVQLEGDSFLIDNLRTKGLTSHFEAGKTLGVMMRAAQVFAGKEKKGCHAIAQKNAMVVDFEVAFPAELDGQMSKVDLACFEERDGGVRLTFWEAKHFTNPELKARTGVPPVVAQVKRYSDWITAHSKVLEDSYRRIARNLVAFEMMGWKRTLHPSIKAVANGAALSLDNVPPVGLVLFGYDRAQKNDAIWTARRTALKDQIGRLFAVGKPAGLLLPARVKDVPQATLEENI